jgi:tetratricopeptide (TPR) repeat protein
LFACAGVQCIANRRRRALPAIAVIAALAFVFQMQTDWMREETRLWSNIAGSNAANAHAYRLRAEDHMDEAATAASRALALAPFFIDRRPSSLSFEPSGYAASAATMLHPVDLPAIFDRSVLLLESGKADAAQADLQQIIDSDFHLKRDFYQSSEPRYYLARVALIRNDPPGAIQRLREAETESPGDPSVLALLYALTRDETEMTKLTRYFGEMDARFYVGRAALLAGAGELAVSNLRRVVSAVPEYRRGRLYLAAACGLAGRLDEGVMEYRAAMRMREDPVALESPLIDLFKKWSQQNADDAFALYTGGIALRQFGHYREALEMQRKAAAVKTSESIRNEIDALQKALRAPSTSQP